MTRRMLRKAKKSKGQRSRSWYTYIVECNDGMYYVGTTNDLERRLAMHNQGAASRFTRMRRPVRYRYAEPHASRSKACVRESELKGWRRERKAALFKAATNIRPAGNRRGAGKKR